MGFYTDSSLFSWSIGILILLLCKRGSKYKEKEQNEFIQTISYIAGHDISLHFHISCQILIMFFLCEQKLLVDSLQFFSHFTMHFRNILQVVFHSLHLFQPIELKTKCSLWETLYLITPRLVFTFNLCMVFIYFFFVIFFLHHLILNLCISGISL